MIREFIHDQDSFNSISDFMQTPFFCWKEEYRNEVSANINLEEKIVDWNFHGLYDIKKLKPEHFENISANKFIEKFNNFIETEIGFDAKLIEIETRLLKLIDQSSDYYIIKNLSQEFYHDWTVFDFFLSGFKISKKNNNLTAIEFGLD